ncbi:sugar ABC transporter permease [Saccharospirillum sp. MSK14-1]|uniref:ABC transporter permease n=1 Tax=Saccharospirillum sp. MSK14-1 TaxID=1897632 RepID=UPI000D3ADC0D|nr:ABC transporter permease [Saccharospirillum sp. MSK14-1]PTY37725.1 sugar ABC transporter permease [Saccharospirillum sp. MSK14-1]
MSQQRIPAWITVGVIPLANILIAAIAAGLVFLYLNINPIDALQSMVSGAFGSGYGLGYTLYYMTSYIFTALAVAVAFKCGMFNIGGEGQAYIGALGVGLVCLGLGGHVPFIVLLPISIIAAAVFGALWALIPAALQAYRGSHIVITTIMFNFIAASLMNYLLVYFLKPVGTMSVESAVFDRASWIPQMHEVFAFFGIRIAASPLNLSIFWALFVAFAVWVFLWRTRWGYEIRSVGSNTSAARYGGISISRVTILTMLVAGALAGFMALNVVQGQAHQIKLNLVNQMGFTGIAVALMGRNHPFGIVLASLMFGFLTQGGSELQFEYSVDARIVVVLQGLVILFSGALQHMMKHPIERLYLNYARRRDANADDQHPAEA